MDLPPSILVTGASSGIGAATATRLASQGLRVFGTSRRARSSADGIEWIELDVDSDDSVKRAAETLLAKCGRLDGLVCNAGFGIFGSVEEVPVAEARQQFETNFFGVLRVVQALLPGMREAGRGRIVIVSSQAAHFPIPFQAHYSASKAAVSALASALRSEVYRKGVQVCLIEPGDVDTPFNDAMHWGGDGPSVYGAAQERCKAAIREMLPKAPGPADTVRAIEHALCAQRPRARYSTGADRRAAPFARRFLPDWINQAILRARYQV